MTQIATRIIPHTTLSTDIATQARAILHKRKARKPAKLSAGVETRLCAVIATLPRGVKVQDVAPLFGLTPSTLSRLRGLAFRKKTAFPAELRDALNRSYVPRAAAAIDPIVAAAMAVPAPAADSPAQAAAA